MADDFFKRPVTFTVHKREGARFHFDRTLDFREGYEMALLEAHIDFRPNNDEVYIYFDSAKYGACHFKLGAHMVQNATDLIKLLDMDCANFTHSGELVPLSRTLSYGVVSENVVQFSLIDLEDAVSIDFHNPYTARTIKVVSQNNVDMHNTSMLIDMSILADPVYAIDVQLPGFIRGVSDQGDESCDLLERIPLSCTERNDRGIYNIHHVPKLLVYKPVTESLFKYMNVSTVFHCEKGNHLSSCTSMQQATLIVDVRKRDWTDD